ELFVNRFDRGVNIGEHLVFALIEEAVPRNDFGIIHKQTPELDEIPVRGTASAERSLDVGVELLVSLAHAVKVEAALARCFLVQRTEAGHAAGGDALRVTGA